MSGSSLDGLDIVFCEFHESSGKWHYALQHAECYAYSQEWVNKLRDAGSLKALDYQLLHCEYGHYIGEQVNRFIKEKGIQYQVQLIASHGHTAFHAPKHKMTAQIGSGAAIAATTGINVVSDLRAMDVALGGQGAPIVPVGEQLLFGDYLLFLNLGGIANISLNHPTKYVAFDVCPANRVLNMLAKEAGKPFDDGGQIAEKGELNEGLLKILNELEYYKLDYPKSLSNDFGTDVIYPLLSNMNYDNDDALRTYVEHICVQVKNSINKLQGEFDFSAAGKPNGRKIFVTGGGAKNSFLIRRLEEVLKEINIAVEVPINDLVDYKEAIIMGLIGVLRWREENNAFYSVTGATRNSIGGAVWMGQEA